MINVSTLIGQPAVCLDDAALKGTVKGVRFQRNRIVALDVGRKTLIPAGAVRSFAGDAITYDQSPSDIDPDLWHGDPIGKRLLSDTGDELGTITEIGVDDDGTVVSVISNRNQTYTGEQLLAIGSYAAILALNVLPPPAPIA